MCVASNRTFKSIEYTVLIAVGDADAMVTNDYFSYSVGCGDANSMGLPRPYFTALVSRFSTIPDTAIRSTKPTISFWIDMIISEPLRVISGM